MTITIYADSNIYRYTASGELEIVTIGSVRFAYSYVHFEENIRNGNNDILKGIELLQAVPLVSNENGEHDVDDIGVCFEYEDPYEKFEKYREDNEDLDSDAEDTLYEMLLRILGADNYQELKDIPNKIIEVAVDAVENGDIDNNDLVKKAKSAAKNLEYFIENDLSEQMPLTEIRKSLGLPKSAVSEHDKYENPIDSIWDYMKEKAVGVSKDQFFGFEPTPGVVEFDQSRMNGIANCHLILNMIGYHPDKGLPKRDKIKNIMSDGGHLAHASLCGAFVTSDIRMFKKAKAIFEYKDLSTILSHIPYDPEKMSAMLVEPGIAIRRIKVDRN